MVDRRNVALGRFGESQAASYYRAKGYAVLAQNWRCPAGEIDLVCARGRTLVICEVKARARTATGHPLEAVTRGKQLRLRRVAAAYLVGQTASWDEIRFDVAAVLGGSLHVVEDAF